MPWTPCEGYPRHYSAERGWSALAGHAVRVAIHPGTVARLAPVQGCRACRLGSCTVGVVNGRLRRCCGCRHWHSLAGSSVPRSLFSRSLFSRCLGGGHLGCGSLLCSGLICCSLLRRSFFRRSLRGSSLLSGCLFCRRLLGGSLIRGSLLGKDTLGISLSHPYKALVGSHGADERLAAVLLRCGSSLASGIGGVCCTGCRRWRSSCRFLYRTDQSCLVSLHPRGGGSTNYARAQDKCNKSGNSYQPAGLAVRQPHPGPPFEEECIKPGEQGSETKNEQHHSQPTHQGEGNEQEQQHCRHNPEQHCRFPALLRLRRRVRVVRIIGHVSP